jgi:hypothetical protein
MLRNRTFAAATGLAVILSALAPTSRAQAPPGPGGMPGQAPAGMGMGMGMGMMGQAAGQNNPVMLLLAPSVQKELKLSDAQKTKAYSLAKAASQRGREIFQALMLNGGNADPQAMMAAGMQHRQETEQAIAKVLDAKQKERFNQIALRAEGPLAVARPEVAAKLRLNEAQNEYVHEVMTQMRQELFLAMRQGAANGQVNPGQARAMATQLRRNAVQEISKVIDRKQKAAFEKMLGAPFDLTKLEAETASTSADPTAEPSKPADTPQAKDAPAAADQGKEKGKEKETTKESTGPARKSGRPQSDSNP